MAGRNATSGVGPRVLQVLEFAGARAPELQALHELAHDVRVVSAADEKLLSQKNQRRRRANAFNSHRMPQRLRRNAKKDKKKPAAADNGGESVRRCRKHERRPHKLVEQRSWEAAADSGRSVLLPTHLWHAKRMKMQEQHGVVVAAHRADKSISAALEALRKTTVVHDMSYYGVLELFGLPELLLEVLQLVSDPAGSDFHGMRFLSGAEEGHSMLYHAGEFPRGAICPVTFMWRPLQSDWTGDSSEAVDPTFKLHEGWEATKRQLWLWIHPAAYMEAATAIASACQQVVDEDDEVQILDRRGHLCRFKLRGKRADELVADLCGEARNVDCSTLVHPSDEEDDTSDHDDGFAVAHTMDKCTQANRRHLVRTVRSSRSIRKGSSATEKRAVIHSVAVVDPRLRATTKTTIEQPTHELSLVQEPPKHLVGQVGAADIVSPLSGMSLSTLEKDAEEPESKLILQELGKIIAWSNNIPTDPPSTYPSKAAPQTAGTASDNDDESMAVEDADSTVTTVPSSLLWSLSERSKLLRSFRKDHEVNDEIFRQRVAAKTDGLGRPSDKCAISADSLLHLLVVRCCQTFQSSSGWDLICSPSMAPVVLKTLVFGGGMVVGVEEDAAIATVGHTSSFPRDYPDTKAGKLYWKETGQRLNDEYHRKPKAKRFSYDKNGVADPFEPKWSSLFPHDSTSADSSDHNEASEESLSHPADPADKVCVWRADASIQTSWCSALGAIETKDGDAAAMDNVPADGPTLVRVCVSVLGRGKLSPNTMLCVPSSDDYAELQRDTKWPGTEFDRRHPDERLLAGYLTSAVYDRPKAVFRAIGYCSLHSLEKFILARKQFGTDAVVALARTPEGRMLRPVRLEIAP